MKIARRDLGLCSYAFRYSFGTKSFRPQEPLGVDKFIEYARELSYGRVLLYDNIRESWDDEKSAIRIGELLSHYDMSVSIGPGTLEEDTFERFLPIAKVIGADSLRIAAGVAPKEGHEGAARRAFEIIRTNMGLIESYGIVIGMENHFSLPCANIAAIVREVNNPLVRCICDTVNSIVHLERPDEAVEAMKGFMYSLHIKDFVFERCEAGYAVNGAILGQGMQRVRDLMEKAMGYNPHIKIELETSIRRPRSLEDEAVLGWEYGCVEECTKELRSILTVI